jgi:hypothetical protein
MSRRVGHLVDIMRFSAHCGCGDGVAFTRGEATPGRAVGRVCRAVLFAVTVSGILFRIVSVEYVRDPVTGWFTWASGTACVCFGTLIFLDREQRANGLLLVVFGILWQLPWVAPAGTGVIEVAPIWVIFLLEINIPSIVLAVVLLRFPERRLQKRYEFIFMTVMATWLLCCRAIHAVTWPCWATPKNIVEWPLWLVNCDLSDAAFFAANSGELVFSTGLIVLLALRILRTRGLDRRIYVPVHIASIVGALTVAAVAVSILIYWYSAAPPFLELYPGA